MSPESHLGDLYRESRMKQKKKKKSKTEPKCKDMNNLISIMIMNVKKDVVLSFFNVI